MKSRTPLALSLSLALLATPVTGHAEPSLEAEQVALLEIGSTTRGEVEQHFGLPQSRKSGLERKTGKEIQVWIYQTSSGRSWRAATQMLGNILNFLSPVRIPRVDSRVGYRRLTVTFDAAGVVADYDFEGV